MQLGDADRQTQLLEQTAEHAVSGIGFVQDPDRPLRYQRFMLTPAPRLLTPAGRRLYIGRMSTEQTNQRFDIELKRLEKRLDELVVICKQLQEENKSLRERQDTLMNERATLLQKNEQVRGRVEAMITRLKAMEQTS